jgi:hypothetical protein
MTMVASLAALALTEVSRATTSLVILIYVSTLLFLLFWQVLELGKRLQVGNAKLFAALIALQAIFIVLAALNTVLAGGDPLAPVTQPVSIGTTAYSMVMSLINTGLFIALILDVNIRQRDALRHELTQTEISRSRLEERQQLLAGYA